MIGLIGAPTSAGAYAPGQERAPQALREVGLVQRLQSAGIQITDYGDVPGFRWRPDRLRPHAQNLEAVVNIARSVAENVGALIAAAEKPLVLGGDCTVGVGTVAGSLAAGGQRTGLIYLDLHADLNVPGSVADGALDWMGVAHMLGEPGCEPELASVAGRMSMLQPDQLLFLGFRADQSTAAERETIDRHRLDVIGFEQVSAEPAAMAEQALHRLTFRCDRLLVHFDVDVIDFTDAPLSENTGRNVGLTLAHVFDVLRVLLADEHVVGLTITELNPDHGEPEHVTLRAFVDELVPALSAL